MPCAVCGSRTTEGAHVRPKESFDDEVDNRRWNIIDLCPNCHTEFDKKPGVIGISQDKLHFYVLNEAGVLCQVNPKSSVVHLKDEYVLWRNRQCASRIMLHLGLVLGYERYEGRLPVVILE